MSYSFFLWRRAHSLMGLWLVIYLIVHLITNSQAALWLGDDGIGFVRLVNLLESLPYLQVIEIVLIAIPLAVHGYWGVKRALGASINSGSSEGNTPELNTPRNRAFTWQRLTSWILLFGIIAHVVQMRFIEMPQTERVGGEIRHVVYVTNDEGLAPLSARLHIQLEAAGPGRTRAIAESAGQAMLLMVRDTFKSVWMCVIYSIFVLAACFHAFNGLWTALITWGAMLSMRSQRVMLPLCWGGVGLLSFLGLAAIWGSYFVNLRM